MSQELGEKRAKELGLLTHKNINGDAFNKYYLAEAVNCLLGDGSLGHGIGDRKNFSITSANVPCEFTAYIIGIRPIKKQTLEDLVREFLDHGWSSKNVQNFADKAREILEGGK